MGRGQGGQRGSVSLLDAAGTVVVLSMGLAVADVTVALMTRSRAQTAADAAALAAAQELVVPASGDPEAMAREYAERNGAELTACVCDARGGEAVVEVRIPIDGLLLLPDGRVVTARARAVLGP